MPSRRRSSSIARGVEPAQTGEPVHHPPPELRVEGHVVVGAVVGQPAAQLVGVPAAAGQPAGERHRVAAGVEPGPAGGSHALV